MKMRFAHLITHRILKLAPAIRWPDNTLVLVVSVPGNSVSSAFSVVSELESLGPVFPSI